MPSDYEVAKKLDELARSGEQLFECRGCIALKAEVERVTTIAKESHDAHIRTSAEREGLRDQRDSLMKILVGARPVLTAHDKRRFDVLRKEISDG